MEREWIHKEFEGEDDEVRISRLEEKVFGTIHDIDTPTRYRQLQKAFDVRKNLQARNRRYSRSGFPTSVPVNIDVLSGD